MSATVPELSVIIPSYNSGSKILDCLQSLSSQSTRAPFEIIVVDSSDDGTAEMLASTGGIELIRSGERIFPGTARNLGAQAARGRLLCFIDADCVAAPDWLQKILESKPDVTMTAVGGAIHNGTPSSSVGTAEYFSELSGLLPGGPLRAVDFLPGANGSVGAEAFREIKGFRDFEKGSDVTFGKDCRAHGIQPTFHPEIVVAHMNRTDLRGFLHNQEKLGWGAGNNRVLYDLQGSWLARFRPAWPLIPAVRFTRIMYRGLRDGKGQRFGLTRAAPLVLAGSIYFAFGFMRGAREAAASLHPRGGQLSG